MTFNMRGWETADIFPNRLTLDGCVVFNPGLDKMGNLTLLVARRLSA
jgi:hypothetical protein